MGRGALYREGGRVVSEGCESAAGDFVVEQLAASGCQTGS
jgi:hypothetical protein